ncbi:hypothetical protein [Agrobacterium rosae]|uniref:Uncharacterized protein n=1 Tax=Agrobacterium rosae TaxID=1972867 RepID=A0A1R3TC64_9HYPH|nr:hypothetical protein [Agrobacterium rosae]SCX03967.1 hypothetical protein DSM25559_0375 [Agrobacterium rosae]
MNLNIPFLSTRTVVCPDGSQHVIQKNISSYFPLSVSEKSAKVDVDLKIPDTVEAKTAAQMESAIKSVMVSIDKSNGSIVLEQRAAYTAYASNPCGSHEWYKRQLENISTRRQRLQEQENMLGALVALAQTPGVQISEMVGLLRRLVVTMTPEAASIITVNEMDHSEQTAHDMIQGGL